MNRNSSADQIPIARQCFAARYRRGDFDSDPSNSVEGGTQRADCETRATLRKRDRGYDVETPQTGAGSYSLRRVSKFHFHGGESEVARHLVFNEAK